MIHLLSGLLCRIVGAFLYITTVAAVLCSNLSFPKKFRLEKGLCFLFGRTSHPTGNRGIASLRLV